MVNEIGSKISNQVPAKGDLGGTLIDLIRANADPGAVSLIDGPSGASISYSELFSRIDVVSSRLARGEKKIALLFIRNSVDSIVTYLALLNAGHVVYLLNPASYQDAVFSAIENYVPDLICGSPELSLSGYLPLDRESNSLALVRSDRKFKGLHEDLSLLLTTSGSTGSQKLVRLSKNNLVANAASIRSYLRLTANERAITTLPPSYSYGLSVLHSHLISGASIVVTEDGVTSREFWRAFRQNECSSLAGVPYTHQILYKLGVFRNPPQSLRYVTQAGGRLDPKLANDIGQLLKLNSVRFFVMYGQTEATARISFLAPEDLTTKSGSIGKAIPGGDLLVVSGSGELCGPGQVGELVYRGPNVMMGYGESREDLSKGDQLRGVLQTGDLGYHDQDGFFYITGRKKRIAKILGNRISLDEVELLTGEAYAVAAIERDEMIVCYYQNISDDRAVELRSIVAEKLNISADHIEFKRISLLPLTPNGKVDYQKLEAL